MILGRAAKHSKIISLGPEGASYARENLLFLCVNLPGKLYVLKRLKIGFSGPPLLGLGGLLNKLRPPPGGVGGSPKLGDLSFDNTKIRGLKPYVFIFPKFRGIETAEAFFSRC